MFRKESGDPFHGETVSFACGLRGFFENCVRNLHARFDRKPGIGIDLFFRGELFPQFPDPFLLGKQTVRISGGCLSRSDQQSLRIQFGKQFKIPVFFQCLNLFFIRK